MRAKSGETSRVSTSFAVTRRRFLWGIMGLGMGAISQNEALPEEEVSNTLPAKPPDTNRAPATADAPPVEAHVHVNQVGYLPQEPKRSVIAATGPIPGNAFCIVDDDVIPEIRYRGALSAYPMTEPYGHFPCYFFADFDAFDRPGRYRLRLSDGRLSLPFAIAKDIYARLSPLFLRYFDVQCCGEPRTPVREKCHGDDGIAFGGPRDGQPFDASGGWHDAGDYLKFAETTSFVTAVMLFAYDRFPRAFAAKLPHSHLPALLDQAKVGLDWLLRMHPTPEEFYYQVGNADDHSSWRLPEDDCMTCNAGWKPRPVYFGVGANLAGRAAAAFALASRLYARYDSPFATRCRSAAESVYQLGLKKREVLTTTPSNFYPEQTWEDDMAWGAAALYQATGRKEYLEQALEFAHRAGAARDIFSVYNTHALAHYTLYPHVSKQDQDYLLEYLREDADIARRHVANPYGLGTPYLWGTADAAAGVALTCLFYAERAAKPEFADIARRQRDFILGCNPFGLSYLIGAGSRYPLFPHHQVANIKSVELTGGLVAGPTDRPSFQKQKIVLDRADFASQSPGPPVAADLPDEVGIYHDAVQDYVTNEPANDYTVKFLLLNAFYATGKSLPSRSSVRKKRG